MTDVYWEPDIPDDLRAIVEPVLDKWIVILPTWVQDFAVRYDEEVKATARAIIEVDGPSLFLLLHGLGLLPGRGRTL